MTTVFCHSKAHQKRPVEVESIFYPLKLYGNYTLKWRRLFAI